MLAVAELDSIGVFFACWKRLRKRLKKCLGRRVYILCIADKVEIEAFKNSRNRYANVLTNKS